MSGSTTHISLLDRLRDRDDQDAWTEFVDRYRELLVRFSIRRGLPVHDAEDVAQASLLRLSQRLVHFEYKPEIGTFRSYLLRVVENELRRAKSRQEALELEPLELPEATDQQAELWNEEWVDHHYRLATQSVANSVPAHWWRIFQALLEGATPAEIASKEGLSVDGVYKVKQRMRERLTAAVELQLAQEEFRERRP